MTAETERRAPMLSAIAATPANALPANEKLMNFAIQGGSAAFKVHCIQCHGSGATGGGKAYPSLADDDWLWGGDMASIEYSIVHGIRNPDHAETRISQMPAFGRDGILDSRAITDVVSHVRFVSGQEKASASSARGAKIFADNCAVCHGPTAGGDRAVGAPNLRDGIWQYGGDRAAITASVTNSRQGVMPRWGNRLDPATIRMLAAYVHSRGGGEAAPAALPVAAASPAAGGAATP
jgi:cytochrome c oxidase cbb3-type subunit 3